jgi:MioC protein
MPGELLAGHAPARAPIAHMIAERAEVFRMAVLGGAVGKARLDHGCIIMHFAGMSQENDLSFAPAMTPAETKVTILVGTMTGTAEMVAGEVRDALAAEGLDARTVALDGKDASVLEGAGAILICTSTYGQGDIPDNAKTCFGDLETKRPSLAGRLYGVIALGDMTYAETFCFGGKRFDELLGALGAKRIGPRLDHDASSDSLPEDAAVEWARAWAALLKAEG